MEHLNRKHPKVIIDGKGEHCIDEHCIDEKYEYCIDEKDEYCIRLAALCHDLGTYFNNSSIFQRIIHFLVHVFQVMVHFLMLSQR